MHILVLNGPNLNLLGTREPSIYGSESLDTINNSLYKIAGEHGVNLVCYQSNVEGDLINRIHGAAKEGISHIIANFAGFTHTSIALRDALLATSIPFTEVHMSNPKDREDFRQVSLFSDIAENTIVGLGAESYRKALTLLVCEGD